MISKKQLYVLLGVLCLVLCGLFAFLALPSRGEPEIFGGPREDGVSSAESSQTASGTYSDLEPNSHPNPDTSSASGEEPVSEPAAPYNSPVDFASLQERCGDIYAWLDIPGTDITYPVVQSQTDDTFYLEHSIDGEEDKNGSLFTEHTYNSRTFSDPVTIIYGHNMRSGAMFGYLQEQFSDPEWFASHEEIIVYQPQRELHYRVFAAVPYGTKHILYQYRCFRNPAALTEFLDVIYHTRKFGTNYREDCTVTQDDRILILSTCLPRSADGRYLVLAVLEETVGEPLEIINE